MMMLSLAMAGQGRSTLKGRVVVGAYPFVGAYVINTSTGAETETRAKGEFSIPAKKGDKLAVYSLVTEEKQFFVSEESFKDMPWVLAVMPKAAAIEEVVVTDTVSIVQPVEGTKSYTVAERRINAGVATRVHTLPVTWQSGGGIAIPLDALFKSGKKKKALRSQLETERKLADIGAIGTVYTKEELTEILQIPAEKSEAFIYYAAEDAVLLDTIKSKNKEQAKLLLGALALNYLKLQKEGAETPLPQQTINKPIDEN